MARVFITGSADGLGRAAARTLLNDGHEVAGQLNRLGRMDAVIHNAGVLAGPHVLPRQPGSRGPTRPSTPTPKSL